MKLRRIKCIEFIVMYDFQKTKRLIKMEEVFTLKELPNGNGVVITFGFSREEIPLLVVVSGIRIKMIY